MNLTEIARRASKFAIDNSPTILTTIGVVGSVTTAYLAGKASFEAADIIRLQEGVEYSSEEDRREYREVLVDRTKLVWKLYIPAVTTGTMTVVCILGANHISHRRAAGMAAAFTIVERAGQEYKDKVIETIGERKEQKVRDDILQDRINNTWDDDSLEIYGKPEGEPFYDKFSDRYVWSTQEDIRAVVNSLNQGIVGIGYATVADFYYLLEMPAPVWSQEIGWNSNDQLMQPRFSSHLSPAGKPVHAFEFDVQPTRNYQRFH